VGLGAMTTCSRTFGSNLVAGLVNGIGRHSGTIA
jgi:hypothetical protein